MNIKKKVLALVRKHKSRNPFEIIKGMNVILIFAPLCGVRGFYQYFQRNNIIYIDETLSKEEQIFVCAHELGHMILHRKINAVFMDTRTYLGTSSYEMEANKFAMELLVSDDILNEYDYFTIEQISRLLGYTEELIKLRIKPSKTIL